MTTYFFFPFQILDKEETEEGSSDHNTHVDGENDGSTFKIFIQIWTLFRCWYYWQLKYNLAYVSSCIFTANNNHDVVMYVAYRFLYLTMPFSSLYKLELHNKKNAKNSANKWDSIPSLSFTCNLDVWKSEIDAFSICRASRGPLFLQYNFWSNRNRLVLH